MTFHPSEAHRRTARLPADGLVQRLPVIPFPDHEGAWLRRWGVPIAVLTIAVYLFLDQAIAEAFQGDLGWPDAIAREVTEFGDSAWYLWPSGWLLILGGAAWAGIRRDDTPAMLALKGRIGTWVARISFVGLAIAASGIATNVFKRLIGRPRPEYLEDTGIFHAFYPLANDSDFWSFPSGHTNTAFALAFAVGLMVPKARLPLLLFAVAVGCSRVILGKHYPADVIGGAVLALVTTLWMWRLWRRRGWGRLPDAT